MRIEQLAVQGYGAASRGPAALEFLDDPGRLLQLAVVRREALVDDGDLLGMDERFASEAEAPRAKGVLPQARLVVQVRPDPVDGEATRGGGGNDDG